GYSPPPYVLATLIQDGNATFTFKRDQTQAIFTFDPSGELIAETDRNGYVTFLAYSGGELATVADPAGRSLTFTYGSNSKIATVTDPGGRKVSFTYDGNGNLATATEGLPPLQLTRGVESLQAA